MAGYPQKKRDPEGFYLSAGFIAGLVALGAFADFARHQNEYIGLVAMVAAGAAFYLYRRAKTHR